MYFACTIIEMNFLWLFTSLCGVVLANQMVCSEKDATLLRYIEWQMNAMDHGHNHETKNCSCKAEDQTKVAFHARLGKNLENLPKDSVVKFDVIITNEGSAYDPSTGIFTCPVNGFYSFSWTFLTKPSSRFHTNLMVEENIIAYTYNENTGITVYKASSQSAVVKLEKGNKVWLKTYEDNGKHAEVNWSSFSGFKI